MNGGLLHNLKLLKDDMKSKGWSIASFIFVYRGIEYIVLVKRFVDIVRKYEYALVMVKFIKTNNINDVLECEASSVKLFKDAKTLREYFGIEYSDHLGDAIKTFYRAFGKRIPTTFTKPDTDIEKTAMVADLSISDQENSNKIYCFNVMRNQEGRKRTIYNSNKTKLLRPDLYKEFENDTSISFCYTDDETKEESTPEILRKFAIRKGK